MSEYAFKPGITRQWLKEILKEGLPECQITENSRGVIIVRKGIKRSTLRLLEEKGEAICRGPTRLFSPIVEVITFLGSFVIMFFIGLMLSFRGIIKLPAWIWIIPAYFITTRVLPILPNDLPERVKKILENAVQRQPSIKEKTVYELIDELRMKANILEPVFFKPWDARIRECPSFFRIATDLAAKGEEALPALNLLAREKGKVSEGAIYALGKMRCPAATQSLLSMYERGEYGWPRYVMRALGETHDPCAVPPLATVVAEYLTLPPPCSQRDQVWEALDALSCIGTAEAVDVIIDSFKYDDWFLLVNVVKIFAKTNDPRRIEILKELGENDTHFITGFSDSDGHYTEWPVRDAAREALSMILKRR
jgi:hypothetical protein